MRLKSLFGSRPDAHKEWTGRSQLSVVQVSAVDGMSVCDMFQRVRGTWNVTVMGFTTGGDVFGGFNSVAMTREDVVKDPNAFVSFKSHMRCRVQQRFVVKKKIRGSEGFAVAFLKRTAFGRSVRGVIKAGHKRVKRLQTCKLRQRGCESRRICSKIKNDKS